MDVASIRLLHAGDLDEARRRASADPELSAVVDEVAVLHGQAMVSAPRPLSRPSYRAQATVARAHYFLASLGQTPAPAVNGADAWTGCARAIVAYANGEIPESPEELSRDDPALRVEQMCARALAALAVDRVPEATQHARRASRAAYAEGLRGLEYLAYWVLARVRREARNLHAATRILGAMARAAPRVWWPLVDWELVLAGGGEAAAQRPLTEPASLWLGAVNCARQDDSPTMRTLLDRLSARTLPARFAREREQLSEGMVGVSELADRGRVAGALHESAERLGLTPAVWTLSPERDPRLRWCVGVELRERRLFDEGERLQTLAACLAEAGAGGMARADVFQRVYGFEYDATLHDGLFRVLVHRTRRALGQTAELQRDDQALALLPRAELVLPEPRSLPPYGDRLLRAIAATPGVSAKELAERIGDKMRTVQRALRILVDTGTCRTERRGRKTVYTVEDTTFSEPTHFRHGDDRP